MTHFETVECYLPPLLSLNYESLLNPNVVFKKRL